MQICFLDPHCLLRPSTNRIWDVRFCEGLARNGCTIELVYPYVAMRYNVRRDEMARYYGLTQPVRLTQLPTPLHVKMPGWIQGFVLAVAAVLLSLRLLYRARQQPIVLIGRSASGLVPGLVLRRLLAQNSDLRIVLLVAELKAHRRYRWLYEQVDGFVVPCSQIVTDLNALLAPARPRVFNLLSPVPESLVSTPPDRAEARARLGLPANGTRLVVYTGKVGRGAVEDEIRHILDAAALLPEYRFLLTGGKPEAVRWYQDYCAQRRVDNVTFTGFLDDVTEIKYYQAAADVLVSYYTASNHDVRYNVPQKITEYMAAGRPIVTPDFPATRDVLDDESAIFVAPDTTSSLAAGIRRAIEDTELAARVAAHAQRTIRDLTFERRTERLIPFFESL